MGLYVGASQRSWNPPAILLAFWLLSDAALFYAAPHYPVGMSVLWLNVGVWSGILISAAT